MNFFEAQARARRSSGRLVLLLLVAVAVLIALASLIVALAVVLLDPGGMAAGPLDRALSPRLLGSVALVVILVVVLGSLVRHFQLRDGGSAVAEALGGRPLNADTRDAGERRLLNVVEEMAIASGLPVPMVYLLEDDAINAFAAGHDSHDAVIGITHGAIEALARDELQGVIAHEFSHILHGDMALNLRLVSLLHGILVIGLIGRMLLRTSGSRRRGRARKGHAAILGMGAGLMVVGYAGTFFGNLIKAGVSRQREYLADASAVQYTRNPEGIGGALKQLAAHRLGSRLMAANAGEFSHLYFGSGVKSLAGLTATHPPLERRIQRVLPHWDGSLPAPVVPPSRAPRSPTTTASTSGMAPAEGLTATRVMESVGQPTAEDIQRARLRLGAIDGRLIEAAHDPFAARALVYGILMGAEPGSRERQRLALQARALPGVLAELERLDDALQCLAPGQRLPLIELSLPVLRQLSAAQAARFRACLDRLMAEETHPGALQWALQRLVLQGLEGQRKSRADRHLGEMTGPLSLLLSTLVLAGQADGHQARQGLERVAASLGVSLDFVAEPALASELDWAMGRLVRLVREERAPLLVAMACCVEHDDRIEPLEAELLSAIAWTLGCPLPDQSRHAGLARDGLAGQDGS